MTTKAEMLRDIEYTEAKLIDNNTIRYVRPNGDVAIRLHFTDILIFTKDGNVIFNTGGHRTVITKNRMNKWQTIGRIFQEKFMMKYATFILMELHFQGGSTNNVNKTNFNAA